MGVEKDAREVKPIPDEQYSLRQVKSTLVLDTDHPASANRIRLPSGFRILMIKSSIMATKSTTHRSSTGKKLYAVRDAKGRFVDIQTYERAHRADLRKKGTKSDKKK